MMKRGKRHGVDPNDDHTFMYIALDEFSKYTHIYSSVTSLLELCSLSHREVSLEQVLCSATLRFSVLVSPYLGTFGLCSMLGQATLNRAV